MKLIIKLKCFQNQLEQNPLQIIKSLKFHKKMTINMSIKDSFSINFINSIDQLLNVQSKLRYESKKYNQQFSLKFNSTETNIINKIKTKTKQFKKQMNKPFPAYHQSHFKPVQKRFQKTFNINLSPKSQSPLSPKISIQHQHSPKNVNTRVPLISLVEHVQPMNLQIDSAKNSTEKQHTKSLKKSNFGEQKIYSPFNSSNIELPLVLNEKMISLQRKSNRLIDKVLAIQQQIQKYAEVEQKQLRQIGTQGLLSPLLQTKSFLHKKIEYQQIDPIQTQHQQNLRKMNILGKNKVKMIQNLQLHIQNLQQKVLDPQQKVKQQIEEQKKQIDHKFANYYKHKNDILKQSKSEKFSFKHLKYLTKQNKYEKSDYGDQIVQSFGNKEIQQNLQTQLKKLKEQFSSYQQRTGKQLQNYKQRLNQNILQKQILKKQLDRQKYQHLKQKIFNKNKPITSRKMISPIKTSRQYFEPRFNLETKLNLQSKLQQKPLDQIQTTVPDLINFPKTDRPTNDEQQVPQFEDLQQFKDEVSMRYIQQNQQIQGLHEKIKDMEDIIQDLRNKLQKNHSHFLVQTEQLKILLQQKQKILSELSQINEVNARQVQDLKNEINDMNNYIFQCKQQNQNQSQQIQEYKTVIQEFVEQVKNLRNQLGQKNIINDQMHQQIDQASRINKMCENEITKLQKDNQIYKSQIDKLQNQIKLKQAKQRYCQALIQKQKQQIKQSNDSSFISQQSTKHESRIQNMDTITSNKIKQLKQQNQQKLDIQRIQFSKYIKQKDQKIQQLQQSLELIKNDIAHKVDQQVNQGIRTFLRYRKHSNHITHQNIKLLIYSKKIYNGDKFQNILFDNLNFKEIKIQLPKDKLVSCRTDRSSTGNNLSLRKLIDNRFNIKINSIKQNQFQFKLHLSIKLIEFAIQLIKQQGSSHQVSSKSVKSNHKKLPSLHPDSVFIVDSVNFIQDQIIQTPKIDISLQQKVQKIQKNYKNYQFIYFSNNKKQTQAKKDKNLVYLSPQVLLSMNQSQHSYCWTLGIIIDEIFNNRPFYNKIDQIVSRKDNYKYQCINQCNERIRTNLQPTLEKMLKKNFKERPTLQIVLEKFNQIVLES